MDRASQVLAIARAAVTNPTAFQKARGAGKGNKSTNRFMMTVRRRARTELGAEYSEQAICGDNRLCVDFYFPRQATIVEIALGLPNPNTEFEKDILKAIMAKEAGYKVRRLLLISRPGAKKKCAQAGRAAMIKWAAEKHGLIIQVEELPGVPRRRVRRSH